LSRNSHHQSAEEEEVLAHEASSKDEAHRNSGAVHTEAGAGMVGTRSAHRLLKRESLVMCNFGEEEAAAAAADPSIRDMGMEAPSSRQRDSQGTHQQVEAGEHSDDRPRTDDQVAVVGTVSNAAGSTAAVAVAGPVDLFL